MEKHFSTGQARRIGDQLGIDWGRVDIEEFLLGLEIELLLAFTRPQPEQNKDGWGQSDFDKTVGFCKLLAELVNHECERTGLRFKVRVEKYHEAVPHDGWEQCGEHFGRLLPT